MMNRDFGLFRGMGMQRPFSGSDTLELRDFAGETIASLPSELVLAIIVQHISQARLMARLHDCTDDKGNTLLMSRVKLPMNQIQPPHE
jgi:hypothetical protein